MKLLLETTQVNYFEQQLCENALQLLQPKRKITEVITESFKDNDTVFEDASACARNTLTA